MTVKLILAQNSLGYIGLNNDLLYHIPQDMSYFKEVTMSKPVIMGRKTWDSLPARFRPLPGRKNIVISSTMEQVDGMEVKRDLLTLLDHYSKSDEEVFVIGGAMIYEAALPYADEIHVTMIQDKKEGDVEAPQFDSCDWTLVSRSPEMQHAGIKFTFNVLRHKRNDVCKK